MTSVLRVVVTNDDGVGSPGLHALAGAVASLGHDVVVVAPQHDHSGFGAAIGPLHLSGVVRFDRVVVPSLAGIEVVAVDGPPALCALSACLGGFGRRPDVVVSGINAGANTGRAVLHSGTVGAALTANNLGVPGLAVSLDAGAPMRWETAAGVGAALVGWVASCGSAVTLNVNVPNVPAGRRLVAHPAMLDPGGEVQATMVEDGHGGLRLTAGNRAAPAPGTDTAVLDAGCVALTPIGGVRAVEVAVAGAVAAIEAAGGVGDRQVA